MIKLEDAQITDVLPDFMKKDPRTVALSNTVNRLVREVLLTIPKACLYTNTDNLPKEVVDMMAIDLRTPYYDENLPLDIKRELVKNTMYWHSIAGTAGAIEKLADVVFGEGTIGEWFEEGLEPGYFTISSVNQKITNEKADEFIRLLESVKRKSQHLGAVQVVTDGRLGINVFITSIEEEIVSSVVR